MTEKVENLHTYLNMCLTKIELEEDGLNDLREMEELEEKVTQVNDTIMEYKETMIMKSGFK